MGCTQGGDVEPDRRERAMPTRSIDEVLSAHRDSLMAVAGVVGIGQGLCEGEPCIRVYAAEMTPEIERRVPDTLEGYAVDVEVTGPIKPQSLQ